MHQSYEKALEIRNTELEEKLKEFQKEIESLNDMTLDCQEKLSSLNRAAKDYLAIIDMYSTRITESMTLEEAQDWSIKMLQHALRVEFIN